MPDPKTEELRIAEIAREREEREGVWVRPTELRMGNVPTRSKSDRQIPE